MFQLNGNKAPKSARFLEFHLDDEEKWYKRIFRRIVKWIKQRSPRRSKDCADQMNRMEENATTSQTQKMSAADIPRRAVEVKRKSKDELSPIVSTESWKGDAQLMLCGRSETGYSRFKYVKPSNFLEKYHLKSVIGQGSFGFVLKAEGCRDSRPVAIKFIYRQIINQSHWSFDSELGMIPSEVFYLKNLNHRGIVQFLDYFDDGRYVYLVTELHGTSWNPSINPQLNAKRNPGLKISPDPCQSHENPCAPCDLFECIEAHKHLPECTIHLIFTQLLEIVTYLSTEGIVHRDLKDENIVVDADYRIKIVDFGCAARIPWTGYGPAREEAWFEKFNGTLAFAPPEVIKGSRYRGTEAEMWTLGVLLYTMAFRQAPFQDAQSIIYGQIEFPYEEDRPGKQLRSRVYTNITGFVGILDLIRKLLAKNPQQRIKLAELQRHPWILRKPSTVRP